MSLSLDVEVDARCGGQQQLQLLLEIVAGFHVLYEPLFRITRCVFWDR